MTWMRNWLWRCLSQKTRSPSQRWLRSSQRGMRSARWQWSLRPLILSQVTKLRNNFENLILAVAMWSFVPQSILMTWTFVIQCKKQSLIPMQTWLFFAVISQQLKALATQRKSNPSMMIVKNWIQFPLLILFWNSHVSLQIRVICQWSCVPFFCHQ